MATQNNAQYGVQTLDGVSLAVGDRVLCTGQTLAAGNGIFIVDNESWRRAQDMATSADCVPGTHVYVSEGTLFKNTDWYLQTASPITLGTTALNFQRSFPDYNVHRFGAVGDGKTITDGATTAGSAILTSATAAFTAADTGKPLLINMPSNPATGTVALQNGSTIVNGTGTQFLTDFSAPYYEAVMINGVLYTVTNVISDTQLTVRYAPTSPGIISGLTIYRDVQTQTTITYVSATQVTMGVTATTTASGLTATYGTDDTTAIQAAMTAATADGNGNARVTFHAKMYIVSENLGVTSAAGVTIEGAGMDRTIIKDIRPSTVNPSAGYGGQLSFVTCRNCQVRDLTVDGSIPEVVVAVTTPARRKGIFFDASSDCKVYRVKTTRHRHESIYAHHDCKNWHVFECVVTRTNSNAINLNSDGTACEGCNISNNKIDSFAGSAILVGALSAVIIGNDCTFVAPGSVGAGMIGVDSSARAIIANNILHDFITDSAGVGAIDIYGAVNDHACINIVGNVFTNIQSGWHAGTGAAVSLNNVAGTTFVTGNLVDDCTAVVAGGKFVNIAGANTGKVHVAGNTFNARAGSNLTVGINVASTVPAGAVAIGPNHYSPAVTTPYALGAAAALLGMRRTVSSTGTTALAASDDDVFVTANGAVTVTLPDPTLFSGGGKRIMVKNTSAQTGTTTIGTAAGTIDGNTTVSLAGANLSYTVESDGSNWQIVAKV
ncbi:right-handed parallel beta-helix repeat-containing protein [Polyangium sp. 15x6]|uniref:right-handed parallel beta-helix repeat-containing protein n=1 Tax=Polyangium sp. 15x6 TaxID=3042687 RepID=UPI002499F721|nr:right-handed parallel beta-helix repeat-containing protein [Polyangium sp. 15x6]MDI3286079.1 hypothetical protein [Polyangium sp. 15x6]